MPQDNSIPLQAFQGESPVSNYLTAYTQSKNMQRQGVADQQRAQQFQWQADDRKQAEAAREASKEISTLRDGDAAGFSAAMQRLVAKGYMKPEEASRYTVNDLPALRAKDSEWRALQDFNLKQQQGQSGLETDRAQRGLISAQTAAVQAKPLGNIDPNTGRRLAPANVQGKDYSQLAKFEQSADAANSIAATLKGIEPALKQGLTGPGYNARRNVAGVMSYLPNLGIEKAITGEDLANNYVNNYDAIEQASKTIGIDTLQKVGGSDTERELLTAIQTTVNNDVKPAENMRRFRNQLKAAEILSDKSRLASEWINHYGSLSYAAPDGTTWQGFWPAYQKEQWAKHLKGDAGSGGGGPASPPPARTAPGGASNVPPPPPGFVVR